MAVTVNVDGLEELNNTLTQLGDKAQSVAAKGLYEGAGIMAESVNRAAETIVTAKFTKKKKHRFPSPEEKAIVTQAGALGIAKFDKSDGDVQTSVGYGGRGYAMLGGKKKPIPLIAYSIDSGTSFMPKQPFIRRGANAGKQKAMDKIEDVILEEFEKITETEGKT